MISKLQSQREKRGLSIQELAQRSAIGLMEGCLGHMVLTIKGIETGRFVCPKPRKTYEWSALAKALNCPVSDIYR